MVPVTTAVPTGTTYRKRNTMTPEEIATRIDQYQRTAARELVRDGWSEADAGYAIHGAHR